MKKRNTPEIVLSDEPELLETGGGVVNALSHLGDEPFYACNTDVLWLNGAQDALLRLAARWDGEEMDGLLLLHQTAEAYGYTGVGDFVMDPLGRLERRPEREVSPYLFTGVQILHPRLFADAPQGKFSLNVLYDRAIDSGRLWGVCHDGEWFHIGTPDGLSEAEAYMRVRYPGEKRR